MEVLASSIGQSLHLLFSELPAPWQPIVMATVIILSLMATLMACSYKLTLPLLLRLEPFKRTPVILRTCTVRRSRRSRHSRRHRKQLDYDTYSDDDNSFEKSYWNLYCIVHLAWLAGEITMRSCLWTTLLNREPSCFLSSVDAMVRPPSGPKKPKIT